MTFGLRILIIVLSFYELEEYLIKTNYFLGGLIKKLKIEKSLLFFFRHTKDTL